MRWKRPTLCSLALAALGIITPSAATGYAVVRQYTVAVQLFACPSYEPEDGPISECATQAEIRGDPARLITSDDYPRRQNREERGGIVRFRLVADTTKPISGDPANGYWAGDCIIVLSSGHDDLDKETCKLIKRRFSFKANSVDEVRTGVDGRIVWVPQWRVEVHPHTPQALGQASHR